MNRFVVYAIAMSALWGAGIATAAPAIGSVAPEFRLQDQNDKWVSLADQKGKWVVLYFYPKDDTPGCTTEACEFRDNLFAFKALGAIVLGVSVQDVASKKAFAAKNSLPFSLLADIDKSVSKAYGVLVLGGIFAGRQSFVIDPQGRIAKYYPTVNPSEHSKELLADLKQLTQAAPAGASSKPAG
jgi:peroxiredoxin Q/BCP